MAKYSTPSSRVALALLILCAGEAVAIFMLFRHVEQARLAHKQRLEQIAAHPPATEVVARELIVAASGIYDSFTDPKVAKLMLPDLRGKRSPPQGLHALETNKHGMREVDYTWEKTPEAKRIVILGDSFVFGYGVGADERLGTRLVAAIERIRPRERGSLEALHLGIPSWNLIAESTYLRRQLDLLQPDLVVHVIVANDANSNPTVRGFAAPSKFDPLKPHLVDILFGGDKKLPLVKEAGFTYYGSAADHESRERYEECATELRALIAALAQRKTPYLLLLAQPQNLVPFKAYFAPLVPQEDVLVVPRSWAMDPSKWILPDDMHWNAQAHLEIAVALYSVIAKRGLISGVELPRNAQADALESEIFQRGRAELDAAPTPDRARRSWGLVSRIEFDALTAEMARQIHGGVDQERRAGPYASFLLRRGSGTQLEIEGEPLGRMELKGSRLRAYIDGREVGGCEIGPGSSVVARWPIPEGADEFAVSVRLVADDFVYAPENLRHAISYRLRRVEVSR